MPHLTIEYSNNLIDSFDVPAALRHANDAALACGLFEPPQVKSRAIALEHFRVGTSESGEAMIHARIHVVAGKDEEVLRALSRDVVASLQKTLKPTPGLTVQITAEVHEMDAGRYAKVVINP